MTCYYCLVISIGKIFKPNLFQQIMLETLDYKDFIGKPVRVYYRDEIPEMKYLFVKGYGKDVGNVGYSGSESDLIERIIKEGEIKTVIKGVLSKETFNRITLREILFVGKTLAEDSGFDSPNHEEGARIISLDKGRISTVEQIDMPNESV